eukprot:CAMPEP_0119207744 /NCGR_PEP_ID=MMETSP1327-20130426/164_1 /TAXON_ID=38833 /ORGANISM="Micromonas pusilla, Strain RCC2306" /LENGTH=47 /DNA_ID= /DNA_START= /DNA_END= /DNA_ORIENTATION=
MSSWYAACVRQVEQLYTLAPRSFLDSGELMAGGGAEGREGCLAGRDG